MIKQLIKFSLNHIPRPVLQRIAGCVLRQKINKIAIINYLPKEK